ncbi:MAG: pyridoxine 5'-phosphate synthase [Planctomycetota bacterium]
MTARLGVNIDHVATLRQARMGREPDPVQAAVLVELAGADNLTLHLREDRRHIQERDFRVLRETSGIPINLEMAAVEEIIAIALEVKPDQVTLVPERRQEVTTEAGLDVVADRKRLAAATERLREKGIRVSLFVDPDRRQLEASKLVKPDAVEIHTGAWSRAKTADDLKMTLHAVAEAAMLARNMRMAVHAGHGLSTRNILPLLKIPEIEEFNIGHSIIARAVFVGIEAAVREMKRILEDPPR